MMVSVILPCLDEARGVAACVQKARRAFERMGVAGEVIVVDNGSTDGSADVAARAGARVVHEPRRGYGAALLRGFEEARGQYFVMGDADDTYDFLEIPRFIELMHERGFDMVLGTRLRGQILPGAMSWSHRWIGNPILSGMLRLLFHGGVSDAHCGMRAVTREAYHRLHLQTTGMEFASEWVVNALRAGLIIGEVPITYYPRVGESKLDGARDAWRHARFLLMFSPSFLFQLPGLLLALTGLFLVAYLAGGPHALFGREWDFHVLLFGALSLQLGYNLILFDVFAKTYALSQGFVEPKTWLRHVLGVFTLERGLMLGGLVLLGGLGLEIKVIVEWARTGYGPLMAVRAVVIGMTAMVLGLETMFGSFLLSFMQIGRR